MSRIIITLPQLADAISRATNIPAPEAEKFVIALVDEISSKLAAGEHVDVPGLGVFAVGGLDNNTVVWKPCAELEKDVNAPFAFFEPVELADGMSELELDCGSVEDTYSSNEIETVSDNEHNSVVADSDYHEPLSAMDDEVSEALDATSQSGEEQADIEKEPENEECEAVNLESLHETIEPDEELPYEKPRRGRFGWIEFLMGMAIGLIIGFVAAIYSPNPQLMPLREALSGKHFQAGDSIPVPVVGYADSVTVYTDSVSVAADSARLSNPIRENIDSLQKSGESPNRFDTVTSARFLTTMARQYYGDYHFWVYIYLYNKDIIKDPDLIPSGTSVKIPDASVYGIDAGSPQSIAKAQALIDSLQKNR